ncbi:MAG TPA: lysophospholipid acyltransferase family protein [Polyangia bacterium]
MLLYRAMAWVTRVSGLWLLRGMASVVAAGYFLFLPRRLAHSVRFYRAVFPERSTLHAVRCAWRQYQDFARVYSERLEIERRSDIAFECDGEEYLAEARKAGRGALVLMSHFGRWEIGARLLARRQQGVTLVMGGQKDGGTRAGVDKDLRGAGVGVVTIPEGQGQASDILQAVQRLREGGMVSLAADRALGDARKLRMPFLGHVVEIAAAPFALALTSGAPVLTVFSVRLGPRRYRFTSDPPITLVAKNRDERQVVMERAAAAYLQRLHDMVKAHPEQWQNFGQFFVE